MLLVLLMQHLRALLSLRHLSDDEVLGVQRLDRMAAIPTLEVLHLDHDLELLANNQVLAFLNALAGSPVCTCQP